MSVTNTVPDEDRYVAYPVTAPTSAFPIPWALWGAALPEIAADLEVTINGIRTTAFTVTGTLDASATPGVVLNGQVVLSAPVSDVTVEIEGLIRPRRTYQYPEGQGVPPRNQNAILNRSMSSLRELWQRAHRSIRAPYGETPAELPSLSDRANRALGFDDYGNPIAIADTDTGAFLAGTTNFTRAMLLLSTAADVRAHIQTSVGGPTILDYTAKVDGETDDRAAILAMEAARGFVRFPVGTTWIEGDLDLQLGTLVFFDPGAKVDGPNTATFGINAEISAPRQQIFGDDLNILLDEDGSHHIKPEWFGAFPTQWTGDVGPFFQKMFNSVVPGRELVLDPGVGVYVIRSQITTSRAASIRGVGARCTHMLVTAELDGQHVIISGDQGVHVTDFQFSSAGGPVRTGGSYIRFEHPYCEARRIWYTHGFVGVDVAASDCVVDDVVAFLNSSAAGSCLVAVRDGAFRPRVSKIKFLANDRPEFIVRMEGVSDGSVRGVEGYATNAVVGVVLAGTHDARNLTIEDVIGSAGSHAVIVNVSAAVVAENITIDGVVVAATMTNGVTVTASGSGTARDILIDGVSSGAISGSAILLLKSGGSSTLDDIRIGGNCNLDKASVAVNLSGSPTNIRISPHARGDNCQIPMTWRVALANDTAFRVNLTQNIPASVMMLASDSGDFGQWVARASTSPTMTAMFAASANVNATTGALAGATGTVGRITASCDVGGNYYIENRIGASRTVSLTLAAALS